MTIKHVMLVPGTLWCGVNDIAENYKNLGESWQVMLIVVVLVFLMIFSNLPLSHQVDTCCRAHDHCPVKVKPLQNRYGLRNFRYNMKFCEVL